MGVSTSKDAASACGADLAKQATSVEALPDTLWGGKTANTAKATMKGMDIQARCVQVNGLVYSLVGEPIQGAHASVITAVNALALSWVWK